MPEFEDLPDDFCCPYRDGCPYLEGLSTGWVWGEYQRSARVECDYEHQLRELYQELDQGRRHCEQVELQNQQLRAQLLALHRRQFKGRRAKTTEPAACPSLQRPPALATRPTQTDRPSGRRAPAQELSALPSP